MASASPKNCSLDEALSQLLDPDGILCWKSARTEALPEMPQWRLFRQKTYGSTEVLVSGSNLRATPVRFGQVRDSQTAIRNFMIRFIYNLLWPIGLLFFLPGYFVKMIRRGGYREKFGQRLGIYDGELRVSPVKARIDLAARGKRWGSKYRVETGPLRCARSSRICAVS